MSRILIVDDEPNWLKTYKRIFRLKKEYRTEFASSGSEALKKAIEFKPDVILLDIMMPGLDGYAVCQDLKNRESTKDTEIIFVSGKGKLHQHPEGGWYFTDIHITMDISVPKEANLSQVKRAVNLTEKYCQITRSLACQVHVEAKIHHPD